DCVCRLARILRQVANRIARPFHPGHAMRPPAALVRFRDEHTARNPDRDVIVRPQSLCEFANPEITEARTVRPVSTSCNAIEIAPDCANQSANITRAAVASLSVSGRKHVPRATH